MQIIERITNETTGTKKEIIYGKNGFFVRWRRQGEAIEISQALPSLDEARIMAAYESKEDAENEI